MPEIFRILKRNFKEKEQLAPVGTILYLLFIKINKMDDIHVDNRLSWVFPHFETNFVVEAKKIEPQSSFFLQSFFIKC